MTFFLQTLANFTKSNIFTIPYVFLAILIQIKKKRLFLFQLQICGSSSACNKKTRCRRMALVPPFWDICQWQNFPGNSNTWPNTSSKRLFLLPFLQPKKDVQKSMLLHWCCPLMYFESVFINPNNFYVNIYNINLSKKMPWNNSLFLASNVVYPLSMIHFKYWVTMMHFKHRTGMACVKYWTSMVNLKCLSVQADIFGSNEPTSYIYMESGSNALAVCIRAQRRSTGRSLKKWHENESRPTDLLAGLLDGPGV